MLTRSIIRLVKSEIARFVIQENNSKFCRKDKRIL